MCKGAGPGADQKELDALKERIARLRLHEQLHLFELVFGDYRRKCEEAMADMLAQIESQRTDEFRQAVAAPSVATIV